MDYQFYESLIDQFLKKRRYSIKRDKFLYYIFIGAPIIIIVMCVLIWFVGVFNNWLITSGPYLSILNRGLNGSIMVFGASAIIILLGIYLVGFIYFLGVNGIRYFVFKIILSPIESYHYLEITESTESFLAKSGSYLKMIILGALLIFIGYIIYNKLPDLYLLSSLKWFIAATALLISLLMYWSLLKKARFLGTSFEQGFSKIFGRPYFLSNGLTLTFLVLIFFVFLPYVVLPIADKTISEVYSFSKKYIQSAEIRNDSMKRMLNGTLESFSIKHLNVMGDLFPLLLGHTYEVCAQTSSKTELWSSPNAGAKYEGEILPNQIFIKTEDKKEWSKVYYNGFSYWIKSKKIKSIDSLIRAPRSRLKAIGIYLFEIFLVLVILTQN